MRGPFRAAFVSRKTWYLSLLNLHSAEASGRTIKRIRKVALRSRNESSIVDLLRDRDWRPHLVGAVAMLYAPTERTQDQAWSALDHGSWVTPQLAAVLSKVDPAFTSKAKDRLSEGCRLHIHPDYSISDAAAKHSAQGPAWDRGRSAKAAASLLALLPPDDAAEFAEDRSLQALLADDIDNSGDLAVRWLDRFLELDGQLGSSS